MTGRQVDLGTVVSDQLPLKKWDAKNWVQFQQPTGGDEEAIEALQMGDILFDEDGLQRVVNRKPVSAGIKLQVAYTLIGSNLSVKGGELLFKPGETCREQGQPLHSDELEAFSERWDKLPPELKVEIVELLYEFYDPFQG